MKHILALLFLVTNFLALHGANNDLDKSKHTSQETIVSLFPAPAQSGVYPDADVEIVFSVGLDEKQVKPNAMRLRQIDGKKLNVKGTVSYLANEKRLCFVPAGFLEPGTYELDVMAIKATKEFQQKQIKNITYRFSVADVHPLSLKVKPSLIEVKEGTTADLKTSVVYDDGSEQTVKGSVVWKSGDISIFIIDANAVATGLKEGQTMVSSSYKGVTSETAQVLVYLEIGGHRLPPEPDPVINNSTLLGIDSNGNGVRDDVERWIYQTYNTYIPCTDKEIEVVVDNGEVVKAYEEVCEEKAVPYHQIVREIAMQGARAAQIIIQEPEKARETTKYMDAAQNCNIYFEIIAKRNNEPILIDHTILTRKEFNAIQFNTVIRARAYGKYNFALSGGVYSANETDAEMRAFCDFDVNALLGK